jgi:outer membrane protein OmpA-like peptidoglycan-associated protein
MERKMKYFCGLKTALPFVLLFSLFVFGCATPKKNTVLEHARTAYKQAQANPDVVANAPVALYEAKQALQKAEQEEEIEEREHLGYLAEKKARIAEIMAKQKMAETEIERLHNEKDRILIKAREYESEQARKEAEMRAREAEAMARQAELARKETEAKALEIQKAKNEAEARALELEKARKEAEERAVEAVRARVKTEEAVAQKKVLERELAELKARQTDRGAVLTLGDILFEVNKAILMPGAMLTIDKLADFLKKYPNRDILIEGHTDSTGSEAYNLELSQRRSDAVSTALVNRDIEVTRIVTKGYGEQYPIASNTTRVGRQRNRRVEIIILDEGASSEEMLR